MSKSKAGRGQPSRKRAKPTVGLKKVSTATTRQTSGLSTVRKEDGIRRYLTGRNGELAVKRHMESRGATVALTPGSRTAVDAWVTHANNRKWAVQIKTSSKGLPARLSANEFARLKVLAKKEKSTPVVATVSLTKVMFLVPYFSVVYRDAISNRKLATGEGINIGS